MILTTALSSYFSHCPIAVVQLSIKAQIASISMLVEHVSERLHGMKPNNALPDITYGWKTAFGDYFSL